MARRIGPDRGRGVAGGSAGRGIAFTLIELLVVVSIIVLLIAILLPSLHKARDAARTVVCGTNTSQTAKATYAFSIEHRGYIQAASDSKWYPAHDGSRRKYAYRSDPAAPGDSVLKDCFSALMPYLGGDSNTSLDTDPEDVSKIFRCPSDPSFELENPGYLIWNNVLPHDVYYPVSYGYNADIACLTSTGADGNAYGRFEGPATLDVVNVYGAPGHLASRGRPLSGDLESVRQPGATLLFADCGTRPNATPVTNRLDRNDVLYYTTNFNGLGGTLDHIANTPWLWKRLPIDHSKMALYDPSQTPTLTDRHDSRINIAFADGHSAAVGIDEFFTVMVSPY
jgi:prepilin-type processing-associated H-X9-DG protein